MKIFLLVITLVVALMPTVSAGMMAHTAAEGLPYTDAQQPEVAQAPDSAKQALKQKTQLLKPKYKPRSKTRIFNQHGRFSSEATFRRVKAALAKSRSPSTSSDDSGAYTKTS